MELEVVLMVLMVEPMISLKTWFAGGRCILDPTWMAGHVYGRDSHIVKTRGTREEMYFFNKLFIARTMLDVRMANALDMFLGKAKNVNEARHFLRKNKNAWLKEKEWNDKVKVNDFTLFEDKFGYDLSFLK